MIDLLNPASWFGNPDPKLVANKKFFAKFDQGRPLAEFSFVVVDTELTGLNKKKDELISIGAVKISNLQIDLSSMFHQFIQPEEMAHTQATLVHRITPEQLAQAEPAEKILPQFLDYIHGSLLVGHHLMLDMHFLNKAARQIMGGSLSNPGVDTMRMAQGYNRVRLGHYHDYNPREISYNLDDLGKEYGLPVFKPHDALEDALQTAYLFLYLIKKFRKGGLVTLKDIFQAGRVGSFRY
jgi:DNA polymerase III subunit epsilon